MNNDKWSGEIELLKRLLDGHGADRTRWPAPERLRFASLIAESAEARRLVAEAAALDRLLDKAPMPSPARMAAAADRIMAAARAERDVARVTVARPAIIAGGRAAARDLGRRFMEHTSWQAAALLAASLLVGVFVGTGGVAENTVETVAEAVGLSNPADAGQVAYIDDTTGIVDEELL